jgi:cellulose synthase/poly-beta-1,6-N-acetylglucosamine synthase-like glycosyltransferase
MLVGVVYFFKRNTKQLVLHQLPKLSIIIPAYNEEEVIEKKIKNTLSLNYPKEDLQIVIVADGSTDNTVQIAKKFSTVEVVFYSERLGKSSSINHAMEFVKHPITVFTDANTLLNEDALQLMVQHYSNPEVGAVSCEKKIGTQNPNNVMGNMEGLYWKYESFIKKMESDLHSVIGAAGELFSIRTQLFKPLNAKVVLDDFMLSSSILKQDKNIKYESQSVAVEPPTVSLIQEAKRKIRIGAGAAQTLFFLGLIPYTNKWLNIQFFSRRVLRWAVSPLAIMLLFFINLYLLKQQINIELYGILLYLQIIFFVLAAIGMLCYIFKIHSSVALMPFYFLFMNTCMLCGFIHYFVFSKQWIWQKSVREPL